jgi:hypothetical protein
MIPLILHVCLGMCLAVCVLLSGLFYATPDLGYCSYTGTLSCFCQIILKTSPHFQFLLNTLSGLLLLCLCAQSATVDEKETGTLIISIIFFIAFTGILSFDIMKYTDIHFVFVFTLFISALVFSLYSLEWNGDSVWHKTGTIAYCIGFCLLFLVPLLNHFLFNFEQMTAVNIANHIQLLCITAMILMFGVYVYS